ncbi:MAG: rRNA maturation RNase YbeY [Coriobacteriia bacterium]|nr:rRNA maturation RNase YbeY [Coriobacteriia bacterium]
MNTVSVDNRSGEALPLDLYRDCVLFVLENQGRVDGSEIAVSLVDLDEIQELNRIYREVDEPTDVLSFVCDQVDDEFDEGLGEDLGDEAAGSPSDSSINSSAEENNESASEVFVLGDVVIAPAVARKHAQEFESSFTDEMHLMLIHGTLHLLGYDHVDDDDYAIMQALEDELLLQWGDYLRTNKELDAFVQEQERPYEQGEL